MLICKRVHLVALGTVATGVQLTFGVRGHCFKYMSPESHVPSQEEAKRSKVHHCQHRRG